MELALPCPSIATPVNHGEHGQDGGFGMFEVSHALPCEPFRGIGPSGRLLLRRIGHSYSPASRPVLWRMTERSLMATFCYAAADHLVTLLSTRCLLFFPPLSLADHYLFNIVSLVAFSLFFPLYINTSLRLTTIHTLQHQYLHITTTLFPSYTNVVPASISSSTT